MDKHESKDMQNVNASWIYFEYPALSGQCIYDIHTSNAADVKPSSWNIRVGQVVCIFKRPIGYKYTLNDLMVGLWFGSEQYPTI
jgi:hypothetical protein